MGDLTFEQFSQALPQGLRKTVAPNIMAAVNSLTTGDEVFREAYKDNLLSYTGVLGTGRFKTVDYITAVKYVSSKLLGRTNMESYIIALPDRYQSMVNKGYSENRISGHVSAYNKTQLVNKIFEQTLVPTYILNADLHQKALNCQANLMISANSEKVRCEAANSLLTHLKVPEAQKIDLSIGVKEDDSIAQLRASTLELVAQQRLAIEAGVMDAKKIAHSKLVIEGEFSESDQNEE
jgi:hypothetical protein